MSKGSRVLLALLLGASLMLVACGGEDTPDTTTQEDTTEEDTTEEDTTEEDAGGGGAALAVTAFDFGFREEKPTVAAGEVALTFRNTGKAPHTFTIEGLDVDEAASPGETVEATFTAEAGTYKFMCTIHPAMVGELVVE